MTSTTPTKRMTLLMLPLLALTSSATVLAQPAEQQPAETAAPAAETPAPEAPAPEVPSPSPESSPTTAPSVEDRVSELEGKIEGMNEPFLEMQSSMAALKKLKFSGYIQGRYEWHDDANYGLNTAGTTARETNRFFVRRARLKTTYTGDMSEFVLQIDAIPSGVSLRDAEASLVINNDVIPAATPYELKLTVGRFKVPFGFAVLQSSSERDLPERPRAFTALFPGERDNGLRLQFTWDFLRLQAAVINGVFDEARYIQNDHTSWKDVVGRLGADFEFIVFGVSAHWGRFLNTSVPAMVSATTPVTYQRFSRLRVGSDLQLYFDVPALGGLALRGEVVYSRNENLDFSGVAGSPCRDRKQLGWYGEFTQNIGNHFGIAGRVDQWDPSMDVADNCASDKEAAQIDRLTAIQGALIGYFSGNLKATLAYEHRIEQGSSKKDDDVLTVQLQSRF